MKCDEMQKRLSAYLDQELDERERRCVEEHLAGCLPCRAAVSGLISVQQSLSELSELEPSATFSRRTVQAVRSGVMLERAGWFKELLGLAARLPARVPLALALVTGLLLGVLLGEAVYQARPQAAVNQLPPLIEEEAFKSIHLDSFDAHPPGSISLVYYASNPPVSGGR